MGAMTGRRAGNCVGGQNRSTVNSGSGRGGLGRGICNWFNASDLAGHSAQETETKLLMEQADALRRELDELNSRLNELKKQS
jgi:hypothetical protein